MENNTEIINAMKLVPELTQRVEQLIEDNASMRELAAEAMKRRIEAEVSDEQLRKIATVAAEAIASTPCALPEVGDLSRDIARHAATLFSANIRAEAVKAVNDAVKDTPLTVEHHHTHASLYEISKLAGERVRRALIALSVTVAILSLTLTVAGIAYYRSDIYLGKKYVEQYNSKYITDTEKEMLGKDIYYPIAVPREFGKTPSVVRSKVKHNREILRQRKAEDKANKGNYSTQPQLDR